MPRRRRTIDTKPAASPTAPVAEARTSVRTNVARVWERAVANMRGARNERQPKAASSTEWTLDASVVDLSVPSSPASERELGNDSGIYALKPSDVRRVESVESVAAVDEPAMRAATEVTLIVYGWTSVEPGTLSWVFPTLRAALAAASAMKNAVRWAILSGSHAQEEETPFDVTTARASGHVLVEGAL